MYFDVKCEDYNGVYLTYAYVGVYNPNFADEERINQLKNTTELSCVFDTGSSHTFVSKNVLSKIGASKATGIDKITLTRGHIYSKKYSVDLCLPGHTIVRNCIVNSFDNNDIGVIVGMDIICNGSLLFYHRNGYNYLRFSDE